MWGGHGLTSGSDYEILQIIIAEIFVGVKLGLRNPDI